MSAADRMLTRAELQQAMAECGPNATDFLAAGATIERLVQLVEALAKQECPHPERVVKKNTDGFGPMNKVTKVGCGTCPPCRARIFLAEYNEKEPKR